MTVTLSGLPNSPDDHALLERGNRGLIDVLKADDDGAAGAIARGDHGVHIIDRAGGRLLAHDGFARGQRRFGKGSMQIDRQRQPDGLNVAGEQLLKRVNHFDPPARQIAHACPKTVQRGIANRHQFNRWRAADCASSKMRSQM